MQGWFFQVSPLFLSTNLGLLASQAILVGVLAGGIFVSPLLHAVYVSQSRDSKVGLLLQWYCIAMPGFDCDLH
jgi:hypothetical protein